MHDFITYLNLFVSVASGAAALIALRRPSYLSGSNVVGTGESFYARMYAARAVPLALASGILPFWSTAQAVAWVVIAAALVQFADAAIGLSKRERGMIVGASIGAVVHLVCGLSLL